MLRIAIAGASGRMGRMLIEAVNSAPDLTLSGALDIAASPVVGTDPLAAIGGQSSVRVTADLHEGLQSADVLIDFTRPAATLAHLAACGRSGTRMVIGTTGFTETERATIQAASRELAIVLSPNMSIGVNVAMKLIAQATAALADTCDIEIVESHHRDKVDAPSGTAQKMGEVVAAAQGKRLADIEVHARHGHTGPRTPGTVGFSAIRGGDVVGDHTVMFLGTGERIEITHRSTSRANYAQGSLRAARFLAGRDSGLYDMDDVLGLRQALFSAAPTA
ncbi:MAG: 4-hydroxy-tetrahydrodipicolinate reductase [Lautropia sp.]|nr:4-hydroxy-tetrahydrodipicolinate reductase [Lautropia sp.]